MCFRSRISEFPGGRPSTSTKTSTTPSPTVGLKQGAFPALFAPLQGAQYATAAVAALGNVMTTTNIVTKDPPSSSDAEIEEELNKLSLSEQSSASELPVLPTPNPTPTPPPTTKVTPPPGEEQILVTTETQTQPMLLEGESPRESSASESSAANEGDENNAATEGDFEAEVDSEIQEVQIELIESSGGYEKLCESQEEVEISPPTIQIEGEEDEQQLEATANVETEQSEESTKETISKSPSTEVASSAKPSPETEMEITLIERPSSACEQQKSPEREKQLAEGVADKEEADEISGSPTKPADAYSTHEELSPTTDEYQEGLQFGDDGKDDYDIADSECNVGYIPPAPTPAPSMAPLAEMDTDTVDDECSEELKPKESPQTEKSAKLPVCSIPKCTTDEVKKKRKKRHLESKKSTSAEDKDKASTSTAVVATAASTGTGSGGGGVGVKESSAKTEADITTVCPWEDE